MARQRPVAGQRNRNRLGSSPETEQPAELAPARRTAVLDRAPATSAAPPAEPTEATPATSGRRPSSRRPSSRPVVPRSWNAPLPRPGP